MTPKEWNEMSPDHKAAYQANLRQRSEEESKTDDASPVKGGIEKTLPADSSPSFATLFLYILTPVPALCLLWTNKILGRGGMEAFGAMATMAFFYIALVGVLLVGLIALGVEGGKGRSCRGPAWAMIIGLSPLLISLVAGLFGVRGHKVDMKQTMIRDAYAFGETWNRGDYKSIAGFLSDRVVASKRDREEVLRKISDRFQYLEGIGLKTAKVFVDDYPVEFENASGTYAYFLRIFVVLEGPAEKIQAPSSILAVSVDGGKIWKFVILFEMSDLQLNKSFPEFGGKLKIPVWPPGDTITTIKKDPTPP